MPKPKIKIKEILKKIKISEVKSQESSFKPAESNLKTEVKLFSETNKPATPSLPSREISVTSKSNLEQVKEELKRKDKELSYLSTVEASLTSPKSYDPSIKSTVPSFESKIKDSFNPMVKPSSSVKEIKKDIKITEIKTQRIEKETELERRVNFEKDFPILSSQGTHLSPTLSQEFKPKFTRKTPEQVREELRNKDKEFSYLATVQASASTTRSYDPSIKSNSAFFEAQSRAERINPTISASPIQEVQGKSLSIRDALNQGSLEPGLRNFNDQSKEYKTERVEKYVAKRRND
jgi:hypothetical protein